MCANLWSLVRTNSLNPEKRKVGGSTPPLTTTRSDLRKCAFSVCGSALLVVLGLSLGRSL